MTKDSLKANHSENTLQKVFLECVIKMRKELGKTYKDPHDLDSEVALFMKYMMDEFDTYRFRVEK